MRLNLKKMKEHIRTPEEMLAYDDLQLTVVTLLIRGACEGAHREAEEGDIYCGNDRLPDIACAVDAVDESFLGYTELFEIENIGRVRGMQ